MSEVDFGDLFHFIRNGMNVKQDKSAGGLPISRIETISNGSVNPEKVGFAALSINEANGWLLEEGDILFSHINSVEHVGKCALYLGQPPKLVHGMNLLNLRCDRSKVIPEFARRLIQSKGFRGRLSSFINKAVNQASVSIGSLKTIPVSVPSLPEQRRIAAILDQADALRDQRRQALAELDKLAQAVFIEIFREALARPERDALGSLVQEFRYGTSVKSSESGFPALRIPNVANGHLDLADLKTVPVGSQEFERLRLCEGDLLFVRTNGNPEFVGRCAVFTQAAVGAASCDPTKFIYASYLIRARLKGDTISPIVLQRYLHEGEGRRALRAVCKTSAGQYNINTESLGGIQIPRFPSGLQDIYVDRLKSIDSLKATYRLALAESDALFASLQHRAFMGAL